MDKAAAERVAAERTRAEAREAEARRYSEQRAAEREARAEAERAALAVGANYRLLCPHYPVGQPRFTRRKPLVSGVTGKINV